LTKGWVGEKYLRNAGFSPPHSKHSPQHLIETPTKVCTTAVPSMDIPQNTPVFDA